MVPIRQLDVLFNGQESREMQKRDKERKKKEAKKRKQKRKQGENDEAEITGDEQGSTVSTQADRDVPT